MTSQTPMTAPPNRDDLNAAIDLHVHKLTQIKGHKNEAELHEFLTQHIASLRQSEPSDFHDRDEMMADRFPEYCEAYYD